MVVEVAEDLCPHGAIPDCLLHLRMVCVEAHSGRRGDTLLLCYSRDLGAAASAENAVVDTRDLFR